MLQRQVTRLSAQCCCARGGPASSRPFGPYCMYGPGTAVVAAHAGTATGAHRRPSGAAKTNKKRATQKRRRISNHAAGEKHAVAERGRQHPRPSPRRDPPTPPQPHRYNSFTRSDGALALARAPSARHTAALSSATGPPASQRRQTMSHSGSVIRRTTPTVAAAAMRIQIHLMTGAASGGL